MIPYHFVGILRYYSSTLGSRLARGLRWILPVVAVPVAVAEGPYDRDSTPIRHPLVTQSARDAVAERPGESIEAILQDLVVYEQWDSERGYVSGVRWVEHEPDPEGIESVEPVPLFGVDPAIVAWLGEPGSVSTMQVDLAYDKESWDETVSVTHQQNLAMLSGEATTEGDLRRIRREVVAGRREAGTVILQPIVDIIEQQGGHVVGWSALGGTIRAVLGPDTLTELMVDPLLRSVAVPVETEPDAGYATSVTGPGLTGIEAADLLQTEPFYNLGYFGDGEEHIITTEGGADQIHNIHLSFLAGAPPSATRMLDCEDSNDPACDYQAVSNGNEHATHVASIIASDLTLGQDDDCEGVNDCDTTAQEERSGVARRSTVVGIKEDATLERLVDLVSNDADAYLLNHSGADPGSLQWTHAAFRTASYGSCRRVGVMRGITGSRHLPCISAAA